MIFCLSIYYYVVHPMPSKGTGHFSLSAKMTSKYRNDLE